MAPRASPLRWRADRALPWCLWAKQSRSGMRETPPIPIPLPLHALRRSAPALPTRVASSHSRLRSLPRRSPPPGMMDLGPANLAGPGMGGGGGGSHNASPSLGPFRPFLPSVPATPHTLSTARAPDRDLAEAGVTGNGDAVPRTPDERRAQLQQWQNKMHAQFRKEMMGKHAADLPPLPLNGHQDSPLANANSQDVGKPYSQIQVETDRLTPFCSHALRFAHRPLLRSRGRTRVGLLALSELHCSY